MLMDETQIDHGQNKEKKEHHEIQDTASATRG